MFKQNRGGSEVRKNIVYAFVPFDLFEQMVETEESMSNLSELDIAGSVIYILFLFIWECIGDVCIIPWVLGLGWKGDSEGCPGWVWVK